MVLNLVIGVVPRMLVLYHKSPVFWGPAAQKADGDFIVRAPGFPSSAFPRNRVAIPRAHHHHKSVMDLGHLLTRCGLKYPEVSSNVCHDSLCQLGNSVSLSWVFFYAAFYLHVSSSSCIPVICLKLVLFLTLLQFVYLFCNLSKCILLFFSYISSLLLLFFWRPLL